jgi:hypothetical protein
LGCIDKWAREGREAACPLCKVALTDVVKGDGTQVKLGKGTAGVRDEGACVEVVLCCQVGIRDSPERSPKCVPAENGQHASGNIQYVIRSSLNVLRRTSLKSFFYLYAAIHDIYCYLLLFVAICCYLLLFILVFLHTCLGGGAWHARAAPDLGCLDHNYFLSEIRSLKSRADQVMVTILSI